MRQASNAKKLKCKNCAMVNPANASYCWLCKGINIAEMENPPDMSVPQVAMNKPKSPRVFQADILKINGTDDPNDSRENDPANDSPESGGCGFFLMFFWLMVFVGLALLGKLPTGLFFSNYFLFCVAGCAIVALINARGDTGSFVNIFFTMITAIVLIFISMVASLAIAIYLICGDLLH